MTIRTPSAKRGHWPALGRMCLFATAILTLLGGSAAYCQSIGGTTTIRVVGADAMNPATPFFVALQKGFFKEAGLNVVFITMGGGAAPMAAALRAGEADVAMGGASQFMDYVARGLVPGKLIGELVDNNYTILGASGITDIRQLKGKVFGISSYGGGDHLYSQAVLLHYGIKPDEVTWVPVGIPTSRLAALMTGKVDGIEMVLTSLPETAKSRIILSEESNPVAFVSMTVFARQGFLAANKPALQKFIAAIGRGVEWARAHPDEAATDCLASGSNLEGCKLAINFATSSKNAYTWAPNLGINADAIKAMIPQIVAEIPQAKDLAIGDFVDMTIAAAKTP